MDGVHDLGGREGFGPIRGKDDDHPFHAEWEARAFGMVQASAGDSRWTIDWFRHCRELIAPADYLARRYFDHWVLTLAAEMIDAGYITVDEIKSGVSEFTPTPGRPAATAEDARAYVRNPRKYSADVDSSPAFAIGSIVRGKQLGHSGHTRLPGYVRGREGTVFAYHGAHLFPDVSAKGEKRAEHLYTVRFASSELWTEARERRDHVFVDLWESYLEPA